ncbi:hypothetical protein [Rhodococcus sp. IEGM 1307]|jgi:hypothetical protein|uniref:hypothetical protein n=1 Tax=Rhodococcus sp. IEGM 1307 TaxID=3047091 RepID=UPI0024B774F7|nr:hypothetical protein [Rhodococcus sp. IEGM 1307]MDI9978804.1 hypothetical protein [Rhodococcus sp. IEGM 1307]
MTTNDAYGDSVAAAAKAIWPRHGSAAGDIGLGGGQLRVGEERVVSPYREQRTPAMK